MSEQLKALEELHRGCCMLEDIHRREEQRPIEERLEEEYRRGYRDGWIQAVLSLSDLMFQDRLSRKVALDICYDLWQDELLSWMHGDCSHIELPPDQTVFKKGRE